MITISVCMITYNHEKYINEAIEGILNQQTSYKVNLIIANDASTDNTDKIINQIISNHPKGNIIKYFCHESNLGMMPNFIFALKKCEGKYIALCEGDDYWTSPLKLQKQVDFLEANSQYSYCGHKSSTLKNGIIKQIPLEIKTLNFSKLIFKNYLNTATLLFRSCYIKDLPDFFTKVAAGDWALQLIAIKDSQAYVLSDYMSVYREQERGLWSNLDRETKCVKGVDLMNTVSVLYSKKSERKMIRKAIKMRKESFGILKPSMLNRLKKKLS